MVQPASERFKKRYGNLTDINADVNVVFNKKKREFYDFYAHNLALMERIKNSYVNLISLMTSDLATGSPKIGSRIKDRSECVRKFEIKYRTIAEKSERDQYCIEKYITDIIGIRVVCLYEDDVTKIYDLLKDNFEIIGITDKSKQLAEDHEKFGYKGLHLDMKLNNKREKLPEYKGFHNFQVEVQIRSIVQDAWSEVDHKLKYKKSIPDALKHKIFRMAALFELADEEFTQIRTETEFLETLLDGDGLEPERTIDSFSFLSVMKRNFSYYNFDNDPGTESAKKIDGFIEQILSMNPHLTDEEFKEMMDNFLPKFDSYKDLKIESGHRLNPFTITRHILYWKDSGIYEDALFEAQRAAFDSWLQSNEKIQ